MWNHLKTPVLFSLMLAVLAASSRPAPAFANVTMATITTKNTSYVGSCPVTITFTGSITASAGTSYTYGFIHFPNGVQQPNLFSSGVGTGSIATNSDTMTFTSSSSGSQDQIVVQKITGGQPDFYSNKLNFSVTCVAPPTPTPGLKLNPNVVNQVWVTPPNGLKTTTNSQECGSHGAGFVCLAALSSQPQMLVLVWCWSNSCAATTTDKHIDKFNIYEVDGGKHAYVTSTGADQYGSLATAGFIKQPANGFTNQCYAVTAVYGKAESVASNAICMGTGTIGPIATAFRPVQTAQREQSSQYGGVPFRAACGIAPNQLCVGWQHDQSSVFSPSFIPIWWYADNYRAYYLFDLSSIAGKYVTSATLKIPIDSGDANCFSAIAEANQDWTGNNNWIGGDFAPPNGTLINGMDVTSIVRDWVNGNPNHGFVLRGSNENLVAESSTCRTAIDANAELDVVHS